MAAFSTLLLNTNHLVFFIVYTILAMIIIVCNLSVLVAILVTKSLRNEIRFLYMLSTCSSDICTGFSCIYTGFMGYTMDLPSAAASSNYIIPTFLGLSYLVTLAAQADRYHSVCSPYKYLQRITLPRTILLIVALWVYAFLIVIVYNVVISTIAIKITSTGTFICYVFTLVIMIGLNIKLFAIARYQLERYPPSTEREIKRSSLYLIIVVSCFFLLTWCPAIFQSILCDFIALPCKSIEKEGTIVFRILPRINAAITPVLYIRGCTPLRISLIKVWGPVCRCERFRKLTPVISEQQDSQAASSIVIISNTH